MLWKWMCITYVCANCNQKIQFLCSHRTKHNALCIPQAQSSSTFLRQLDAMIHPFLSCCSFVLVRPLSISFYSPGHMTHPDSVPPISFDIRLFSCPCPCSASPRDLVRNAKAGSCFTTHDTCTVCAQPHATRGMNLFFIPSSKTENSPKTSKHPTTFSDLS